MWVILGIAVVAVAIWIVRELIAMMKKTDSDACAALRCKACGGNAFDVWKNEDGTTTYECRKCGKCLTRY